MRDWETVVLDIQVVFGEVWHRCLAEPWPWWRGMVMNLLRRPETITFTNHIAPRLKQQ